jgi:tRNA ligase
MLDVVKQLSHKHCVRTIILLWNVSSLPYNELHRICTARVVGRGENHQSLRPSETREHENIVGRFISEYQPFDNGSFNYVVDIDIKDEPLVALEKITAKLCDLLEIPPPDREELEASLDRAKNYKISFRKEHDRSSGVRTIQPRYYGVALEIDLANFLGEFYAKNPNVDRSLFDKLVSANGVERRPHVTLVHNKEVTSEAPDKRELWEKSKSLAEEDKVVEVKLGPRIFWDERVLAIEASPIALFSDDIHKAAADKRYAHHVTVGTADAEVRPVEGKLILEAFLDGKEESAQGGRIHFAEIGETVTVKGRVRGL